VTPLLAAAAAAAAGHAPPPHGPMMIGYALGPAVMVVGLLAAAEGSMRRSRPVVAAATVAVLAGAFSVTVPGNPLADWLGLLALAGAIGFEVGGALATRGVLSPPGNAGEMERLRLLHGHTHISCFAGEGAKSGLQVGGGVIGYQVRWGVAVAVGDPLTAPGFRTMALTAFLSLCAGKRWVPCFFQTDPGLRAAYRAAGFRMLKFGEEAVVEIGGFELASPARADARHELSRARRSGLEAASFCDPEAPGPLWAELEQVSRDWLQVRGGREMGFSLGRLREVVDSSTRYTVARDQSGRVHAFCSWVRMGDDGIALDLIRRRPDAAAGAVDLCIVTAIEWARSAGLSRLSLGSVPFRESLGDAPDGGLARRVRARLYQRGYRGYSYRGLSHFKAKFATRWESRDLAVPLGVSGLLALAALIRLHSRTEPLAHEPPPVPLGLTPAPLP